MVYVWLIICRFHKQLKSTLAKEGIALGSYTNLSTLMSGDTQRSSDRDRRVLLYLLSPLLATFLAGDSIAKVDYML